MDEVDQMYEEKRKYMKLWIIYIFFLFGIICFFFEFKKLLLIYSKLKKKKLEKYLHHYKWYHYIDIFKILVWFVNLDIEWDPTCWITKSYLPLISISYILARSYFGLKCRGKFLYVDSFGYM